MHNNMMENFIQLTDDFSLNCLTVPVPENEKLRLTVLRHTNLLNSNLNDDRFDRITSLAARVFEVPIALVSLVDVNRQWFKSKVGLEVDETHRDVAFCSYAILEESPDVFVVLNAIEDLRFANNPLVTESPFIRFYAGASLLVNGLKIGTLCIIDSKPRQEFTLEEKMNLIDMAAMVVDVINRSSKCSMEMENQLAKIIVGVVENCKYPLLRVNNRFENVRRVFRSDAAFDTRSEMHLLGEDCASLLKYVEATIETMQFITQGETATNPPQPIPCNIIDYLKSNVMEVFEKEYFNSNLSCTYDSDTLLDTVQWTHPVYISLIMLSILDLLSTHWNNIMLTISFESNSSTIFNPFTSAVRESIKSNGRVSRLTQLGYIVIVIETNGYKETKESHRLKTFHESPLMTDENTNILEDNLFVDSMLCQTKGEYYSKSNIENGSCLNFFKIPCKLTKKDREQSLEEKNINDMINEQAFESYKSAVLNQSDKKISDSKKTASTKSSKKCSKECLSTGRVPSNSNISDKKKTFTHSNSTSNVSRSDNRGPIRKFLSSISNLFHKHGKNNRIIAMNSSEVAQSKENSTKASTRSYHKHAFNQISTVMPEVAPGMIIANVNTLIDQTIDIPSRKLRVLIVEDTKSVQKLLQNWFSKNGCEVSCADNGSVGLTMLTSNDYDLVIVDYLMPVMSGLEMMDKFQVYSKVDHDDELNHNFAATADSNEVSKKGAYSQKAILIGLSATAQSSERDEGFNYGMALFITKPANLKLMKKIVNVMKTNDSYASGVDNKDLLYFAVRTFHNGFINKSVFFPSFIP
eukprot:gene9744-13111_t